jgi:transcription elongation factor Elf1
MKEPEETFRCPACSRVQVVYSDDGSAECFSCGQKVELVFQHVVRRGRKK